ncbi:ABC transporter permease, partial [Acinetobacter baumannii]
GFGIVFLIAASTFGGTIAQSVVEEKQTRVVEILISAIPVRALLAGKVLGNTVLAMAQIVLLAAVAVIGLAVTDQVGV